MKFNRATVASHFRIALGGNAIATCCAGFAEGRSALHLAAASAELGWLILLLFGAGVAAIVDAVINDLLRPRFHWRIARRQRHFILAAMAFSYVAQLYVAFYNLGSTGLLLYYLWNASMIMLAAFLDAHQRSKDATCAIACN